MRKVYSQSFRKEAAELVLDKGYSLKKACEAMEVSKSALRIWVRQLQQVREKKIFNHSLSMINSSALEQCPTRLPSKKKQEK